MVTRELVLATIREHFAHTTFSTPQVARILDVSDQAARVSIGWLVAAGAVEVAGRERCAKSSRYSRSRYKLTGKAMIARVPRAKAERRAARQAAETADKSVAATWLARKW